ncbi:MAG: PQQ-binding-like beta-propeller repeat protein, partial [Planctomycetes bacterium]|nr:PQQ-binding-like beta-propeller repeat protein [Planctomycetota bacterium]
MASARAQIDPFAGFQRIGDTGVEFRFDPDRTDVATYYVKASGESRFRIETATARLRDGDAAGAVEPLVEVVQLFPDHMAQVANRTKSAAMRWVGAAEYAQYLLATLPDDGARALADYAELRIGRRLERAIEQRDETELATLAARWAPSPQGMRALLVLGDLYLERGAHDLAARCYLRRLAFDRAAGRGDDAALAARTAAALRLAGAAELARERAKGLEDSKILVGGSPVPLASALEPIPVPVAKHEWSQLGGTNARDGLVRGDVPAAFTTYWQAPAFFGGAVPWSLGAEFPFHPVVSDGVLVTTDGLEVRAHALFSEQPLWTYGGPLASGRRDSRTIAFEEYVETSFMNNSGGTLARSLQHAATIGSGRVLVALLDANRRTSDNRFDGIKINPAIPTRSLHCVDFETGERVWTQRRPELGRDAFENRVSIVSPPIVVSDRVYAVGTVLEGAINCFALCFALDDGRLLWRTPIAVGQQELTMFNKPFKEFSIQPPTERDGTLFLCTNLGLVAALDTLSGQLRWISQYDSIPIISSQNYMRISERNTNWENDPPIVSNGVCIVAPLDSHDFIGFDVSTGKRLWLKNWNETQHGFEHLLGVDDGVLVLAGQYALGFYDVRSGQKLKTLEFQVQERGTPTGRPCLGERVVYVPFQDGLAVMRWQKGRYGIENADGSRFVPWDASQTGNVLVHGDFTITQGREATTVYFDVAALAARAAARTQSTDATAADFLTLGNLERLRGRLDVAVEALTEARRRANGDESLAAKADDGLFHVYRELAAYADDTRDGAAYVRYATAAARHARKPFDFLSMVEGLLTRQQTAGDDANLLATLDWIDAVCPDTVFPFKSRTAPLKAGLYTLDLRARLAQERARPADAVAAWQRMIERYSDESLDGDAVRTVATQRIADAITAHGATVYERFEAEARALHEAARRDRDVAALQMLVDRYPNSADRVAHRLDLARAELDRNNPAGVFKTVFPLVQEVAATPAHCDALALLARAAAAAGDAKLARQYWKRVVTLGEGVPTAAGEGESFAGIARAELERLGDATEFAPSTTRLKARPALDAKQLDVESDLRTQLVPIEGEPLPQDASLVLVYEPGLLRAIDVGAAPAEKWRIRVDTYDAQFPTVKAWCVGGRIVFQQRATIYAIDPATGAVAFRRELDRTPPIDVGPCGGLLLIVSADVETGAHVEAMELASGSIVWHRPFRAGIKSVQRDADDLLVLSRDRIVTAIDPLLGA